MIIIFFKSNLKDQKPTPTNNITNQPIINIQQVQTTQQPTTFIQQPLPNNCQQQNKQPISHKKLKCKPYCQNNGTDEKCALICSSCNRFGHYADVCGKDYCGECNSSDHRFNKKCKTKQ